MDQKYHPVLIYSVYYPNSAINPKGLSSFDGIVKDSLIRLISRIKLSITRGRTDDHNHSFLATFINALPENNRNRANYFLGKGSLDYYFTTPLILNQILADIVNRPEGAVIESRNKAAYMTLAIFDTILLYNEHHFKSVIVEKRPDDYNVLWEIMLMQDVNGFNHASFVRTGAIKQAIFVDFLKIALKDKYIAFETHLNTLLGVKGLIDVALLFIKLQVAQERQSLESDPLMEISKNHELYRLLKKLDLVLDTTAIDRGITVTGIMLHPFLKLSNDNLCFTGTHDFAILSDVVWKHFLFTKGNLNAFIDKPTKEHYLSYLGLNYTEKFLMKRLFESLEKPGYRVIDSDDKMTPDFTLIINEVDVFIIEVKSVSLNYKVWENGNLTEFKQHLDDQYASNKKGVIQLQKCLQNLVDDPIGLFNLRKPLKKVKVFPIIIYTEPHVSVVGVNDFVKNNAPVLPDSLLDHFSAIYPVTMIHCDFFLENIKAIRNNKQLLKQAILRYHRDMTERKKRWQKVNTTFNYSKAMESFDNYSIAFGGLYAENQNTIAAEIKNVFNSD